MNHEQLLRLVNVSDITRVDTATSGLEQVQNLNLMIAMESLKRALRKDVFCEAAPCIPAWLKAVVIVCRIRTSGICFLPMRGVVVAAGRVQIQFALDCVVQFTTLIVCLDKSSKHP